MYYAYVHIYTYAYVRVYTCVYLVARQYQRIDDSAAPGVRLACEAGVQVDHNARASLCGLGDLTKAKVLHAQRQRRALLVQHDLGVRELVDHLRARQPRIPILEADLPLHSVVAVED